MIQSFTDNAIVNVTNQDQINTNQSVRPFPRKPRHPKHHKILLSTWFEMNQKTRLTADVFYSLCDMTRLTYHQVYDFLAYERKKLKKRQR